MHVFTYALCKAVSDRVILIEEEGRLTREEKRGGTKNLGPGVSAFLFSSSPLLLFVVHLAFEKREKMDSMFLK